jgi:hypothetical protein
MRFFSKSGWGLRVSALVVFGAVGLLGQQLNDDKPSAPPAAAPLSLGEKYLYNAKEMFEPPRLLMIVARAGVDQANDSPSQWGQGGGAFGLRLVNQFGRTLLKESIASGVMAVDHEDPRYFRLGKGSGWTRTKYACVHTFVVRSDSGNAMPAYSTYISDLAMPMISKQWRPGAFRPVHELRSTAISLGVRAAVSMWKEFSPDLKKHQP